MDPVRIPGTLQFTVAVTQIPVVRLNFSYFFMHIDFSYFFMHIDLRFMALTDSNCHAQGSIVFIARCLKYGQRARSARQLIFRPKTTHG